MNFLGLHIITIGLLAFYANVTAMTEPKPTLYVFGDSMSDIGKFGDLVYGIAPRYPYWQYRFSSGPVWIEYLALLLDYKQNNMAIGMSTANRTRGWHLPFVPTRILPSTLDQIHSFKRLAPDSKLQTISAKDIVVLEIGANDYLFMLDEITSGRTTPAEFARDLASDVKQQVGLLQQIGFSNIVITNLPLMQYMPAARYLDCEVVTARVVESYNSELSRQFSNWAQVPGLNSFISIDLARFFELAIMPSISSALGLIDITSSCVGANIFNLLEPSTNMTEGIMKLFIDAQENVRCKDPSTHFFFDIAHMSERVHRLLGYYAAEAVSAETRGQSYELTDKRLLELIYMNKLNSPAPKPAAV